MGGTSVLFFVKLMLEQLGGSTSSSPGQLTREMKPKLTLGICLKFHMKIFDPLGLVMLTKMIGNLLFRISSQVIKQEESKSGSWYLRGSRSSSPPKTGLWSMLSLEAGCPTFLWAMMGSTRCLLCLWPSGQAHLAPLS